ncbi:hypothetical protein EGR_04556 [Echinococcus granulosus]|uniref:Uncharacterized protein n=1 Tax=Echinococcus granulosus TaxID=6210 RepID=W6UQG0_ECHGR|nr:hypothetical protein EGR_04556 [Echinococcus granulosus]EUB60537.1 hypothetical protein EGR_04556 [Echinococcus granulosus]
MNFHLDSKVRLVYPIQGFLKENNSDSTKPTMRWSFGEFVDGAMCSISLNPVKAAKYAHLKQQVNQWNVFVSHFQWCIEENLKMDENNELETFKKSNTATSVELRGIKTICTQWAPKIEDIMPIISHIVEFTLNHHLQYLEITPFVNYDASVWKLNCRIKKIVIIPFPHIFCLLVECILMYIHLNVPLGEGRSSIQPKYASVNPEVNATHEFNNSGEMFCSPHISH